jgi:hypothetical protein
MTLTDLTEMQSRTLKALIAHPYSGAWDIAYYAGYRPSKKYRLPVSRQLHRLCELGLAYRARPADGIGATQRFYATPAGKELMASGATEGGGPCSLEPGEGVPAV